MVTHLSDKDWQGKIQFLEDRFSPCRLCPRECRAERNGNNPGICGALKKVKVASFNLHQGEEPPVTGTQGSGTIFFSGCTLKCIYCQNYPISHLFNGQTYSVDRLADIMLDLQERKAHNINLVTATPYLYHIVEALHVARKKGLVIPIVYNSSGYEHWEVMAALEGVVDIYLPDLKYGDGGISQSYTGIKNYLEYTIPSLREMYRQVGDLQTNRDGIAIKGMILRHLILPGHTANSKRVLRIIAGSPFRDCHLSLMSQYFPAYKAVEHNAINRQLTPEEYNGVKDDALSLGFSKGWFQDMNAAGGA